MPGLTIIVPCYNEKRTITDIVKKLLILDVKCSKEIIIVDDGSDDGSKEIIEGIASANKNIKAIYNKSNIGKGGAIRSALKIASGKYVVIQDADLEYQPKDIAKLLFYAKNNNHPLVYGSRYLVPQSTGYLPFFYGCIFMTKVANLICDQKLTDACTGYKLFEKKVVDNMDLKENGFACCMEITAKASNMGIKIHELPISYKPRKFNDGKKIRMWDGIEYLYALIKHRYFSANSTRYL